MCSDVLVARVPVGCVRAAGLADGGLAAAKVALRREVRSGWRELVTASGGLSGGVPLSADALVALRGLCELFPGPLVAYESLSDELCLAGFLEDVQRRGGPVWVPVVRSVKGVCPTALPLGFCRFPKLLGCEGDGVGCAAPSSVSLAPFASVVLVPAVALGRDGVRLGRGGGWYDRALAHLRAVNPRVVVVGCVPSSRLLAAGVVAREPHDQLVDFVLTELELFAVSV